MRRGCAPDEPLAPVAATGSSCCPHLDFLAPTACSPTTSLHSDGALSHSPEPTNSQGGRSLATRSAAVPDRASSLLTAGVDVVPLQTSHCSSLVLQFCSSIRTTPSDPASLNGCTGSRRDVSEVDAVQRDYGPNDRPTCSPALKSGSVQYLRAALDNAGRRVLTDYSVITLKVIILPVVEVGRH